MIDSACFNGLSIDECLKLKDLIEQRIKVLGQGEMSQEKLSEILNLSVWLSAVMLAFLDKTRKPPRKKK